VRRPCGRGNRPLREGENAVGREKKMKRVLVLLLMGSAVVWGQKTRFGQESYVDVSVLVQSSRLVNVCDGQGPGVACGFAQELKVLVDRKEMTIVEDGFSKALLRPGTYPGKIGHLPEGKPYEAEHMIELQFPDGKRRTYLMVGGDQ
jgi:hypothetical protein